MVSVIDACKTQNQEFEELKKQMNTKIQEWEQLQKQIDDKSSSKETVPYNVGTFDNCSKMLKECKQTINDERQIYEHT